MMMIDSDESGTGLRGCARACAITLAVTAVVALAAGQRAGAQQAGREATSKTAAKSASTTAIDLAPHRAVYAFTLGTTRSSNSIASLSGRMVYEFTGSTCDGYTQVMRFVTRTASQEGETVISDQRTNGWEDASGTHYRFHSSQYRNDQLTEQVSGTAERASGDGDMKVELMKSEKTATAIGNRALFPVQHSIKLLEAARRGESNFKAEFYDGSEGGEKSYIINAQIGRQVAAGFNKSLSRVGQADKLDGMPAWPVGLSYFEHGAEARDAVPNYEMSFVIFLNGVSRRLVIDNGEYTMKGELTDLVMLDPTPCKGDGQGR